MDGTFYLGNKIIDGSLSFLDSVKKRGKCFYFFTNNSSKNARYYQHKLNKMGCLVQEKDILTSNQVILKYLQENQKGKRVYLVGNPYLREDFETAGLELVEQHPDLVVVGFDTTLEYQRISRACHFIRKGVPFYAVNPDLNCPVEEGFIPDCGSICAMITASTGIEPVIFGKPSPYTLQYILDYTGLQEQDIAYVGDRLYTDIAMGKDNPMNTILVLSGETRIADLAHSAIQPDLIFNSLKELKLRLDELYQ
jgi:HAD superfamily hydrolase (TIGR01457 family)